MKTKIKLAVVSSAMLMRQGLVTLLKSQTHLEVSFHASGKAQVLNHLRHKQPDVILLSVEISPFESLEILEALKDFPHIRKIVLMENLGDDLIVQFSEQNANAILTQNTTLQTLENAIIEVHANGFYFPVEVMQAIGRRLDNLSETPSSKGMTTREVEVLHLVVKGKTSREIAELLFISTKTVENHRHNLLRKAGCKNQAELRHWVACLYAHQAAEC